MKKPSSRLLTSLTPGSLLRPLGLAAALAAGPAAFGQSAGLFSYANAGTGSLDASVGLSTTKSYLHAYNLGDTLSPVINGVPFTGLSAANPTVTTIFSTSGLPSAASGGTNLMTAGSGLNILTNKLIYGGAPEVFNFNNLTAGQTYTVTYYNRSWEAAYNAVAGTGGRRQNLTATGASTGGLPNFDEDVGAAGQGSLTLLRYTFIAASNTQAISFSPVVAANTMHQYGVSVENVFAASTATTWSSGTDWTSSTWTNGTPNSVGATATFPFQGSAASLNLNANVTAGNLQFDGTNGWGLTSTGGSTLTLQSDVGASAVVTNTAGNLTIAPNVVLGTSLGKLGNGNLTISGNISGPGGVGSGGGTVILNGTMTYAGSTTVSAGTLTLNGTSSYNGATIVNGGTLNLNGANSSSGTSYVSNGTLNIAANANTSSGSFVVNSGGVLNLGSFSDYGVASAMGNRAASSDTGVDTDNATAGIGLHIRGGTVQYTGSTPQSTNRQMRISTAGAIIDASGSVPTATLSFSRTTDNTNLFDTGGTRTVTLTGTNTGNNTFALILLNQAASATSLTKSGVGTWNYSGLGTYTGNTTVKAGKLILSGNRVAGAGGINVGDTAGVTATLDITNGTFTTGTVVVGGVGSVAAPGIVNQTGGSITVTGTELIIGNGNVANPGNGTYNLSAGTLNAGASTTRGIILGTNDGVTGTFNLSGTGVINMGSSNLQVGRTENSSSLGSTGNYNQTGGTATIGYLGIGGMNTLNNGNIGNFSVTGGTFTATSINGIAGGNNSIANLTFGGNSTVTLPVFPATRGTGAVLNLSFDGGTLVTVAPSAGTTDFFGPVTSALIGTGGAKINVATGNDISTTASFSNVPAQAGSFTKLGTGALTVSSASTYTGPTNVNAGSLYVAGLDPASAVTVAAGAAFGGTGTVGAITTAAASAIIPGGPTAAGTLSPSTLSLTAGSIVNFELGGTSDLVNVTTPGGLAVNGGVINLYATGGVTPLTTNGTYTLFDYAGTFAGDIENLTIGNAQAGKYYSLTDDTVGTTIQVTVGPATTSTWSGLAADGLWSSAGNWDSGSPNNPGSVASFGPAPASPTAVTVDGAKTVGGISFSNTNSYTLAGSAITLDNGVASAVISTVSGSHVVNAPLVLNTPLNLTPATSTTLTIGGGVTGAKTVVASGPGTTLLTGTNAFANLSVTGGTAILAGTNTFGSAGIVAGTLQVGNGGTAGNLGSSTVAINGNAALSFNRSDDFTVANNLLGSGAVVSQNGTGVVTLSGINTIATASGGSVNLNAGTIRLGSATALPAGVKLVLNGGTLDLNTNSVSVSTLTGTLGSITDLAAGAGTSTVSLANTSAQTLDATMADGPSRKVALTKTGLGTLTVTGANTFTGGTTIVDGTVTLARVSGNALSGPITIGDTVASDTLLLAGNEQISDASVLTFNSGGSNNSAFFRMNGFSETVHGIQTTGANAAVIENTSASVNSTLTVDTGSDSYTYDGIIRNSGTGTVSLMKNGSGTQTLANTANVATTSHTGTTTVNDGVLKLSNMTAYSSPILNNAANSSLVFDQTTRNLGYGATISGFGGLTKEGAAILSLSSTTSTYNGGTVVKGGTHQLSSGPADGISTSCVGNGEPGNTVTVNSGAILAINATAPLGASTLQSATSPSIVINAGGKLTGNGFVAFIPNLTLNGGTVEIGNGATAGNFNTNLGLLGTVVVGGTTPSTITTTGTGPNAAANLGVRGTNIGTTFQVAEVTGSPAADLIISSVLKNVQNSSDGTVASPLTKTGPGTLLLSGANTYSGGTNVNEGTIIAASPSALGAGALNLTNGNVKVSGLTTVASATFGASGHLALQLTNTGIRGTDYDALNVTGALVLDGTITVTLNGLTPALGQSFDLIDAASTDVVAFNVTTDLVLPTLAAGLVWDRTAFASTGVVTIVDANSFAAYASNSGLSGSSALPDADPDGDGISNALEFAFGLSPVAGNDAAYRSISTSTSGELVLAYRRPIGGVSGVTYGVEVNNAGLVGGNTNWVPAVEGALNDYTRAVVGNGDGTETVTITFNGTVSAPRFGRISVTY